MKNSQPKCFNAGSGESEIEYYQRFYVLSVLIISLRHRVLYFVNKKWDFQYWHFDQTRKYCQSFHESTATLKLGKAVLIENSLNFNTNTLEIPHSYSSSCELSSLLKHVFQFFVSTELLIKTASKETPGGDDITAGWGEHWNCTTTLATSIYTVRFLRCSWYVNKFSLL